MRDGTIVDDVELGERIRDVLDTRAALAVGASMSGSAALGRGRRARRVRSVSIAVALGVIGMVPLGVTVMRHNAGPTSITATAVHASGPTAGGVGGVQAPRLGVDVLAGDRIRTVAGSVVTPRPPLRHPYRMARTAFGWLVLDRAAGPPRGGVVSEKSVFNLKHKRRIK
jgi:hypothetical protein